MKLIKILLLMLCLILPNSAFALHQLYADMDGINIPYGTKFELSMAQDVTTKNVAQGDMIQAYLTKDIYVNNKLILPSRTVFRGRVKNVEYSKSLSRPAKISIVLDHLVTTKGRQLSINSGLASNFNYILQYDGNLTTSGNYFKAVARDVKKAGKIVPRTIKWGATSGDNLFVGAKYLFVPVAAVGGVVACAGSAVYNTVADLFRHGDEVIIKKDTIFNILLLSTLEIPS
ncbi:MAG: hypothetical protein IJD57_02890 [Candidatus Gastranaerophilales bacterium]|nr:hypothetical protein [Candidatus Gastranaerophilales bacterium]